MLSCVNSDHRPKVINSDPRHSDHRLVIIDTHGSAKMRRGPSRGLMPRFEAQWLEEEGCMAVVQNAWSLATDVHQKDVDGAIKGVMCDLKNWSTNVLGDLDHRISKIKKELELWRRKGISQEQVRREDLLRFKLQRLEDQRETYWQQRPC
jgi:hypothetical protein